MPEAAGRWKVAYGEGRATSVEPTDSEPDLLVDETTAVQLILGRAGLEDVLYRPDVRVIDHAEVLTRAFVRRPTHLSLG